MIPKPTIDILSKIQTIESELSSLKEEFTKSTKTDNCTRVLIIAPNDDLNAVQYLREKINLFDSSIKIMVLSPTDYEQNKTSIKDFSKIIAVGGYISNSFTNFHLHTITTLFNQNEVFIGTNGNKAFTYGETMKNTHDAVHLFSDKYLVKFLTE